MLEGRLLNERYQVKRRIGGGGMANVYLGFDNILERDVAIKVLRLEYSNDEEFITRFHREAQSATSLSHPNIVSIYDVGEEDDIYYMVMEYIEGLTLKEYIQRYGPIPIEDCVEIMLQITSAIEHAHTNHIVHRDIKPQNILIDSNRVAKVTDFGIALALTATSLTQTNSILGSVHYLSPEQARGGVANQNSDIYSLGIVLFEMLTGEIPFNGQSAVSIALKHLQTQTPSLREEDPTIPQSLENIVLKATTKDPFERYQTAADFEKDLMTALDPDRINEPAYIPPSEPGDSTKVIPILTDEQMDENTDNDQTIVKNKIDHESTRLIKLKPDDLKKKKQKKKKSKKKKIVIWLSIILFTFLIASLVALFVLPDLLQPDDIELQDLTGEHVDDAIDILKELGLEAETEEVYSDDVEPEYVERTDPKPNSTVKEGTVIKLYVSQGPEPVELQNYVGQSYQQVKRILEQQGYLPVERTDSHSDQPEGQIIGQQPDPGSGVIPSETVIIFNVSIGEEEIELENLDGMNLDAAEKYLEDKGLVANITEEHSSTVDEGKIIRHSPQAGTDLEKGSIVNLVVSLGEEEQSPITHNLTVTVPYTGDQNLSDEEDQTPKNQEVRIYIDDMNHDLKDLYETDSISEDTEFKIRLVIAPDTDATYKIERDDQVIIQKTIVYEDVEGD
ncbi:Stk1 family PASTA domain-containing Ser/Thr kinase [Amphibacillus sp. MSJ-3]|uniref:Stk1 family PASTA domain-containing Ser/Thr kinase n=1 Tax=Amphibacillus sp. MSJ-3 TaxID=2841505 RepID=UPI001C0F39E5|nr:Stk1 family PASTA domain-containing Ser/Thr kinase [Amphibacillus sp. MSJ-3]MBU5594605.1 Stk1 family PASTA domain-containing Ser/Thr kinase [Amphibacillus sp. MSJ-3]